MRTRAVRGGVLLGCIARERTRRLLSKRSPSREVEQQTRRVWSGEARRGCARAQCEAAGAVQVCVRRRTRAANVVRVARWNS